jgi:hypothetical protein
MGSVAYYEETIRGYINEARAVLTNAVTAGPARINDALRKLSKAKSTLTDLQREVFLLPVKKRRSINKKCEAMRQMVTELDEEFRHLAVREQLLGSEHDLQNSLSIDQSLAKTELYGEESLEIGQGIISDLSRQAERLRGARDNTDLIRGSVANTGRMVGRMEAVQRRKRIITFLVVVMLVFAIFCVIYIKLF